jgi:solute carrier family 25 oxoglutarate transporter 11
MSSQKRPMAVNFAFGGIAGCSSTLCVHPFDVIRVQMQIDHGKPSFFKTVSNIQASRGIPGLYAGMSAGLVRQLTYGLTKFGVYNSVAERLSVNGQAIPFTQKLGAGLFAGMCAAIVGNPAEVALVRMTADSKVPAAERRNYKNVVDALVRVSREEGVPTLWRGILPHINRAAFLSAAQLATFGEAKEKLVKHAGFQQGVALTFTASLFSGLACTIASCPMDVLKTRIQNMKTVNGVPEYSGAIDCFSKTVKAEGPMALFKGFGAFYVKLAPYTTIVFIVLEQLRGQYAKSRPAV